MAAVAGGEADELGLLEDDELKRLMNQERAMDLTRQHSNETSELIFRSLLNRDTDAIPTKEFVHYQKIEVCLRPYIRSSSMFQPAKAILHNALLIAQHFKTVDFVALKSDLVNQGLYDISTAEMSEMRAVLSYSQDVTYGVTSDEELRGLKESELEDFLRDRLVIVLMVLKSGNHERLNYELWLDRPDSEK